MIDIKRKEDCVGCNACVQICPKTCISFNPDEQGFFYPKVDLDKCINCHLCERVCPVLNQGKESEAPKAYAAKNIDAAIKKDSSSGGVFFALAKRVIEEGGVIFGARFNKEWKVEHGYGEDLEGVKKFQGSKYLQSQIGESFIKVEQFLKKGRKVLFSGTPCQVAGLRLFLRKDYGDQLVLVDTACHGVPSPLVWNEYLDYVGTANDFTLDSITDISFRDKRNGWDKYGMRIVSRNGGMQKEWYSPMHGNIYMRGFLKDLYIRPSCFACPAKCGKSGSDLTLADFWGIQNNYPELYEKGYYSLVIDRKGILDTVSDFKSIETEVIDIKLAYKNNPALLTSAEKPKLYHQFWELWSEMKVSAITLILNRMKPSILMRIIRKLKRIITKYISH
ncbi:MAG: 4Fe-4S dicluster domain-containing protein [Bacteroidales bacterium]|nr:4Fe-4S dicluster domain-containing protein [Bacteroidales bacterium]